MSESPDHRAVERAARAHRTRWGEPQLAARAPGRVNLIGEHTDYNEGFVLPMAIPFDTAVVASRAAPGEPTEIWSEGFGHATIDAGSSGQPPTGKTGELGNVDEPDGWAVHLRGVPQLLAEAGVPAAAWRATIASDVPIGASLSSSASLEVALAHAILALAGAEWSAIDIARLGQRVENEVVGLPSGIMDQLISASAVAGHASLIDCRTLRVEPHRLPDGVVVAVMDTGTRRQLAGTAFADRRATCASVAQLLGVPALRDASLADLDRLPAGHDVGRRRARHVISENQRTVQAAGALSAGDPAEVGRLMDASHESLRDDYEVSSEALDCIVEIARRVPGCLGARMTGGGFAGCAVALVATDHASSFPASVASRYQAAQGRAPTIWLCEPAGGASVGPPPVP